MNAAQFSSFFACASALSIIFVMTYAYIKCLDTINRPAGTLKQVEIGAVLGAICFAGIVMSVHVFNNVGVDGKLPLVAIASIYFGPVAALVSSIIILTGIASMVDGVYAFVVLIHLVATASMGEYFRRIRLRVGNSGFLKYIVLFSLLMLGIMFPVGMLIGFAITERETVINFSSGKIFPMSVLTPLFMFLYCMAFNHEFERLDREADLLRAGTVLVENERKYKTIFNQGFHLAGILSPDGKVLEINRIALEMIGATIDDVRGRLFWECPWWSHSKEATATAREAIDEAISNGASEKREVTHFDSFGRSHNVEFTVRSVTDENGVPLFLVPEGIDITGLRVAMHALADSEDKLKKLIAELEAKNAELERFTYTVSHDLKSPLITIKGFLGVIEKDLRDGRNDRVVQDIARVLSAADKMSELLADLLELSRIGRMSNPPAAATIDEIVAEASELLAASINEKKTSITVSGGQTRVFADRKRMVEAFQNLFENSIKYSRQDIPPAITVSASASDGTVTCHIADNGIGVEKAYLEKIFGLFEKLDPNSEGTGVGLALVRRIAEVHGGTIKAESEGKGRGLTMVLRLPAA